MKSFHIVYTVPTVNSYAFSNRIIDASISRIHIQMKVYYSNNFVLLKYAGQYILVMFFTSDNNEIKLNF